MTITYTKFFFFLVFQFIFCGMNISFQLKFRNFKSTKTKKNMLEIKTMKKTARQADRQKKKLYYNMTTERSTIARGRGSCHIIHKSFFSILLAISNSSVYHSGWLASSKGNIRLDSPLFAKHVTQCCMPNIILLLSELCIFYEFPSHGLLTITFSTNTNFVCCWPKQYSAFFYCFLANLPAKKLTFLLFY